MSRAEMAMDWFGNNVLGGFKFYLGSGMELLGYWMLGIGAVVAVFAWMIAYDSMKSSGTRNADVIADFVWSGIIWGFGVASAVAFLAGFFFGPIR